MRVLSLYLTRLLLARFALVLLATVSFLISFELLERSDNVLNATDGELTSLAIYALLRLPDFTAQLLPTATLLAAILTLAELTRHHELEVIWTAATVQRALGSLMAPAGPLAAGIYESPEREERERRPRSTAGQTAR